MLTKTRTVSEVAKAIAANKGKQDDLERQLKMLKEQRAELDLEFMTLAEAQGEDVTKVAIKGVGTVSIEESVVPQAKDWDAFYKFIGRNKYYHLLERRPSVTGCRELWEMGKQVPGVEKFTKRSVKLRLDK